MSATTSAETSVQLSDTAPRFSKAVSRVARGETHILVEEGGQPVAAIISMEEYRRFKAQEAQAARDELFDALTSFSQAFADVSDEELERELAKAQAEVRAEMRAERDAAAGS